MALDPVCKMFVNENIMDRRIFHNEITYHFCSTFCKELFVRNPIKYIKKNTHAEKFNQDPKNNFTGNEIQNK